MPIPHLLNPGSYTGSVIHRKRIDAILFSETLYVTGQYEGGLHCHENPHISFVFQGGDVEKRNGRSYGRSAGDLFYYESGEHHQTVSRALLSRHLNIEFEKKFFIDNGICSNQIKRSLAENLDSKFLVIKILEELRYQDENSKDYIEFLTLELVSQAKKNLTTHIPNWVKNLSDLLNDRWDENISLKELSSIIGVHPITISKYFSKFFLCTYGEYMRKLKIDKSISLIRSSEMTLTEISYQCGFVDQSHFIRNFKQFTGFLPKDFQRL